MGLILSIFAPNLLLVNNEEPQESSQAEQRQSSVLEPVAPVFPERDDGSEIKYLSKRGPPTVLGPTPGNVPSGAAPVPEGLPVIHPPKDTTTKVADTSVYDTLAMTPDVDWSKKTMLAAPNDAKKNK